MKLHHSRFIAESYFEFHSDNYNLNLSTSKKRLALLNDSHFSEKLTHFLKNPPSVIPQEVIKLENFLLEKLLLQWADQINNGFNLSLYGFGSKSVLLNHFCENFLEDHHILYIKCYETGVGYISFLQNVLSKIFDVHTSMRSLLTLTDLIIEKYRQNDFKILLILEMADAPCMRDGQVWRSLSRLSEHLRIIFTFESINSNFLLDVDELNCFNLLWHDATTFRPYSKELESLLISQKNSASDNARFKGAQFVLASLTDTARSVFRVLVEYQLSTNSTLDQNDVNADLEEDETDRQRGLSIVLWYQKCQEQFLVSNEVTFRTQLTEFVDHELVRSIENSGQNGITFYIPFDEPSQLEALMTCCKNNSH